MSRKKKINKVNHIPDFCGYKPYGKKNIQEDDVKFFFEEYQALYYADYKRLPYTEAAEAMNMSKSTFGRLIIQARTKIATALVQSRGIEAQVGEIYSDNSIMECVDCFHKFVLKTGETQPAHCPSCNGTNMEDILHHTEVKEKE